MNIIKSDPRSTSEQFKETALSYLNEIYGAALRLSNDEVMAEELTVRAYERVCRKYFHQFRDAAELRVFLHRELLRTSLAEKSIRFKQSAL